MSVSVTKSHHVATITFANPPHNALPGDVLSALAETITAAGKDSEINVIVLQSAGDKTFCAGASFDELLAVSTIREGTRFFMGFANVINACRTCPKLIVGRVQGKAVGGGVGLAAAVDFCIATKYASIKLSELALGIGPFVVGPAVERKIGTSAFTQLSINAGEWQTSAWAKEKGLFTEVFETTVQMDEYISHFTSTLAAYSTEAMKALKHIFWQECDHWDTLLPERASMSGELIMSDHARNAIGKIKSGS